MRHFMEKHMGDRIQGNTNIDKYLHYFDGNMKDLVDGFAKSKMSLEGFLIVINLNFIT